MRMIPLLVALLHVAPCTWAEQIIDVHYLAIEQDRPPTLSSLDPTPADLGRAGVELGLADTTTTGGFLGQTWRLTITELPENANVTTHARTILASSALLIIDASDAALLTIADLPEAANALLFNATNPTPNLRDTACRANLLHTMPSTDMRTDALAQFFVKRRWSDLAMIAGPRAADQAFARAVETSLAKFGLSLTARKDWAFESDMRRNAAAEVPLFTQDLGRYDALIVADEAHDFGRYIAYNTWHPRPVTGSEGLTPRAWDRVVEQWGAAQLQSRFTDLAARPMEPEDYAAWAAIRALGEAVTRTESADPAVLRSYLLGPDFALAGFKGRPLTFRGWNGQLRQPIALVQARAMVAMAPLDGFLHPTSELDTLGLDRPESQCEAFQ